MHKKPLKTNKNHPAIKEYSRAVERGMKSQHVVPSEKGWIVKRGGAERATKVFESQSDAIDTARRIAKNSGSSLFIHRKDGRIRERRDY